MTSLNTYLRSKPQGQAGGANGAVTFYDGKVNPHRINLFLTGLWGFMERKPVIRILVDSIVH
jgi:hypothetical protein